MLNKILDRMIEWITIDPTVSLLMIVATIVIIGTTLIGSGTGVGVRVWIVRVFNALFQVGRLSGGFE